MQGYNYRIGKIYISSTNPEKAKVYITLKCLNGEGGYICVSNMRMIRYAGNHPDYARLMEGALVNLPDGKPLAWLGRLWGLKEVECVNGPMIFKTMLTEGDNGLKHYLLGDTQDILEKLLELNRSEYHANIVGAEALPFTNVDKFDYDGISSKVRDSEANIIWTAMRAPKQDEFNQRLSKLLPNVILIGVGRAFRLLTGDVTDAPGWAHKAGIAGLFTRKVSLSKALWWYFVSSFYVLGYAAQICCWRLTGRKCYEL
jgi:N-acetylglucosaminyldiphosphoundecaprenol N-acetyl-beta-D-mannosaminyltransferase